VVADFGRVKTDAPAFERSHVVLSDNQNFSVRVDDRVPTVVASEKLKLSGRGW
jgi:hypothetical protein